MIEFNEDLNRLDGFDQAGDELKSRNDVHVDDIVLKDNLALRRPCLVGIN